IAGNTQNGNDQEVSRGDSDSPLPDFHASILDKTTYNVSGDEEAGANVFDFHTMLTDLGGGSFAPSGGQDNPANTYGLSVNELIDLGNNVTPVVNSEIITYDMNHNSRESKKVM